MLTITELKAMLALQNTLNEKVNPQWLSAGYEWHRAIVLEGAELMEHIGWKWWKKQEMNLAQAQIELIDIWHFYLSDRLVRFDGDVESAAWHIVRAFSTPSMAMANATTQEKVDVLIHAAGARSLSAPAFQGLMHDLDLSWGELQHVYVAKNVLNLFRQDHGYKEGTYRKDWAGQEDNVALDQLMFAFPKATPDDLRAKLAESYAACNAVFA